MCILYNVTGWNTPVGNNDSTRRTPATNMTRKVKQQTQKQKKQKSIVTIIGVYRNDKHKLQPISADNPKKP